FRGRFRQLRNFRHVDNWGDRTVTANLQIVQVFSYLAYSHIYILGYINPTVNHKRERYPGLLLRDSLYEVWVWAGGSASADGSHVLAFRHFDSFSSHMKR